MRNRFRKLVFGMLVIVGMALAPAAFARGHLNVGLGINLPGVSLGISDCRHCGYGWGGNYYAPAYYGAAYAPAYYGPAYAPAYYSYPVYGGGYYYRDRPYHTYYRGGYRDYGHRGSYYNRGGHYYHH